MYKIDKQLEIDKVNQRQEFYVNKLVELVNDRLVRKVNANREVGFTSDTGTGKTRMIAMFINKMTSYYPNMVFMVSSLSRGGLGSQVRNQLNSLCQEPRRFKFYSDAEIKAVGTRKTIQSAVSELVSQSRERGAESSFLLWIRDEGHRATTALSRVFKEASSFFTRSVIVNVSATNSQSDVVCNFADTMMLRTPVQVHGKWGDALDKLEEIKKAHKKVPHYNPCAVFRCTNSDFCTQIEQECLERGLRVANIINDDFDMSLCDDDNEVDVIINKYKIVEGIDIRRAHVLYIDNAPKSEATKVQFIGRARRNALFWRTDIDIFDEVNYQLLEDTTKCFVYYNVIGSKVKQDDDGNLIFSPSNICSCEKFVPGSVLQVMNGSLPNGLRVAELKGQTGQFTVLRDEKLGFNYVEPIGGNHYYTERHQEYMRVITPRVETRGGKILQINPSVEWAKKGERSRAMVTVDDILSAKEMRNQWFPENYYYQLRCKSIKNTECATAVIDSGGFAHILEQLNGWVPCVVVKEPNKRRHSYKVLCTNVPKIAIYMSKVSRCNQYKITGNLSFTGEIGDYFNDYDDAKEYANSFSLNTLKAKDCTSDVEVSHSGLGSLIEADLYVGNVHVSLSGRKSEPLEIVSDINIRFLIDLLSNNDCAELNITPWTLSGCIRDYTISPKVMKDFKSKLSDLHMYSCSSYNIIENDRELSLIGGDNYCLTGDFFLSEHKGATYLVSHDTKTRQFIEQKYASILCQVHQLSMKSKSVEYGFPTSLNKVLGYCVEYYAKYMLYGKEYIREELKKVVEDENLSEEQALSPTATVLACLEKYRADVASVYGAYLLEIVPRIKLSVILKEAGQRFVQEVISQANVAVSYLNKYSGTLQEHDYAFVTEHIVGLADFLNKEHIFDLKCTGKFSSTHVKQICLYHYLSTKRSDLEIRFGHLINTNTAQALVIDFKESKMWVEDILPEKNQDNTLLSIVH